MPAKYFLDGENKYLIKNVLARKETMPGYPLAYLAAIGAEREWDGYLHVTDLYNGLRQTFLKYCAWYGIDPDGSSFAVAGTLRHKILEDLGSDFSEVSVVYRDIKGTLDVLELISDLGYVITDYKNQGAYAVRKYMGWTKKSVPVLDDFGVQVYLKSGKNIGKPKYKGEWFLDPSKAETEQYDYQLNLYRKALETTLDIKIDEMRIFFMLRDGGLAATRDSGLKNNTYLLPVKTLSNEVIDKYIDERAVTGPVIKEFLDKNGGPTEDNIEALKAYCPMMCTPEERWYDRESGISKKCEFYCPVKDICGRIN